ncbi:hypothetical protein IMCC14465_15210 [alpha proteobacterium IMCC14465]|uniref:Uncharacterized protein n=1 Tax=alpha proteobacterium IMCC14465 TaxID=1220535 RepID=J9DYA5_9PROT|nr:hypothetical protein IMCC14465_15210 [alpha proteobacterium IMCC14465]
MPKIIKSILTFTYAFVPAMLVLNLLGITLISSFAMLEIIALGVNVPASVWLATLGHDLVNLFPLYSAIFGIGLIISLIVAARISRMLPISHHIINVTAGFVSAITALSLMNSLLGVTPIGASRTIIGFIALSACSAIAALTFSYINTMIRRNTAS